MSIPEPYTLISGASSGIGRQVALRLSATRRLLLQGRDAGRLEQTRLDCQDRDRHRLWHCDFEDAEGVGASLEASLEGLLSTEQVGVAEVVHCAGSISLLPVRGSSLPVSQAMLAVNYLAAASIVRTLLQKKVNGKQLRSVVLISSIFARLGARGHSGYCASKAALDGWMRAAAVELAPQVRVNSILPGAVHTPMASESFSDPELLAALQRDYPLGPGEPGDVAGVVEFLLSPAARWMTGQEIVVDGGRSVFASTK